MVRLPDKEESYWLATAPGAGYPALNGVVEVDVAIAGGGIAGLTAAYMLKQAGKTVAVVEKNTIGSSTTGRTTGKITSQHGLFYAGLQERLGKTAAGLYATGYEQAIEQIEQVVKHEKIDCQWRRADNYVYTTKPDQVEQFKDEAKVAAALGLPAEFTTQTELPFAVTGAVKFGRQATFYIMKYLHGLAKAIDGGGSYVFEHGNITGFSDGSPAWIKTGTGKVVASDIIVATKIPAGPLAARLAYAVLEHPFTSYIVAGKAKQQLSGMYISPDKGQYSLLTAGEGEDALLLVGGESHTPGLGLPRKHAGKLAEYAQANFGVDEIKYYWKAMDYLAYDDLPLVGKLYLWSRHLYVTTGFKKWGLTTSMVSATILRDLICGEPNNLASLFDSTRTRPIRSIPHAIAEHWK